MPDPEYVVREAVEEDIPKLLAMREAFFDDQFSKGQRERAIDHAKWLGEATPKLVTNRRASVLLVQCEADVIGYCYGLTRITPGFENATTSTVEEFWVDPDHRGSPAARTLFEASREDFFGRGADRVQLRVLADNSAGHRFWQSVGFEPYLTVFELPPRA